MLIARCHESTQRVASAVDAALPAPMAIATAAGMLSSSALTLLVVPIFYLLFDDAAEWVKRGARRATGRRTDPEAEPA